jgi:carbonyl reductase 1
MNTTKFSKYGLSKAVLASYTMILARTHPNILSSCVSPGWVATNMGGKNANLTPEQGTKSIRHCLKANLGGNGWFYGSDGLRSPLTKSRDPGTPAYNGK